MTNTWLDTLKERVGDPGILDRERLIVEVTETIARLMDEQDVGKSQLANLIGHKPAYVTKLLSGENNFTLATLSKVFMALKKTVHFYYGPAGDVARIFEEDSPYFGCEAKGEILMPRSPGGLVSEACPHEEDVYHYPFAA